MQRLRLMQQKQNQEATLTASYNKVTKQLILDFPTTYQLESNYTYYVTIKIAPTAEAYQETKRKKLIRIKAMRQQMHRITTRQPLLECQDSIPMNVQL